MKPITEVAAALDVAPEHLLPFGHDKAKILSAARQRPRHAKDPAKLVLVSALTPTPAGEGKTTTTIGLGDALSRAGQRVCLALREPSLGPCFGIKGGGTGGGRAQLYPSDDINLHFTGDFHAITAAHNLLAAAIDNALHFESLPGLDPRRVLWPRVLDVNDRSLRDVVVGLGGKTMGVPREGSFDITAASEVMAMMCLAEDAEDLRARLDRTIVAVTRSREPIRAGSLGVVGAMLALMRDVMHPNLAQTLEGTPAVVHGGPFANIAHGCNSVVGTKMALHLADWVVTEAGFGFDLGAEKFYDIKCRSAGLDTAATVLVATVRALKMHGGRSLAELEQPDPAAVEAGLCNLDKHVDSVRAFGKVPVVALNRRGTDTDDEIAVVRRWCESQGVRFAVGDHFARGGEGATELAAAVIEAAEAGTEPLRPIYPLDASVEDKIAAVSRRIYGAADVAFTAAARRDLEQVTALGLQGLPICMAKTQNSLSDDPGKRGRPEGFTVTVRGIEINAGAGFLVVLTGDMLRMPGLPKRPQFHEIDLADGVITGLR
ncbi:MAG: formate--tetrahydrofolate ligase [Myxococcales bacterium]|nr:formate--tetrahydrofolate ligase [Myxococcales bacterium]MCB9713157.1 formate--tetrahydrofolate ligase [Myxococcales bacterium]